MAFKQLKSCLLDTPILICPNISAKFYVFTDDCDYGAGAVLTQLKDEYYMSVEYMSYTFKHAEIKYCTYEKELLAILIALRKFCYYLLGSEFTIFTDNQALKYLLNCKEPNGRRA